MIIILEFFIFSFIGWVLDCLCRRFETGHWVNAGFFRGPICPIYGIGGLVLMFLFESFSFLPTALLLFFAFISAVLVELVGGIFSEKVLQVKLWDYSKSRFNYRGYIDLVHSFYWLILVIVFYYFIYPHFLYFEQAVHTPKFLDLPALIISIFVFAWLTIRKVPSRFLDFKQKVLDLSIEEYQHIVADIKKFYRVKNIERKKLLEEKIEKRLEKTGAKFKKEA